MEMSGGKTITLFLVFPIQVVSKEWRNSNCPLFDESAPFRVNLKED